MNPVLETITIEPRFNGPPESGNGGYTCGRLAAYVDGPAEVTLRSPPPLGRPLTVERDGDAVALRDGEALVAEARPTSELAADAPPPVALDEAADASATSGFLDVSIHPFPSCFVCGPARDAAHPGLRIFAGALPGRDDAFAAAWTPDPALAGADGTLPSEIVWAALDCPTSAPVWNDPDDPDFLPIVLARLAVRIVEPVIAGEPHTIVSWPIAVDGRKRHAGAALHTAGGELAAVSRALWIELKPPAPATS
jgi:hypothetical protein